MTASVRARLYSVIRGEKPDRVPWYGDLAYWIVYMQQTGQLPREFPDTELLKLHRDLGVGFYLQGYFPFRAKCENVRFSSRREDGCRIGVIETPYGTLTERSKWLDSSFSTGVQEHYVKTADDLKALRYWYENTTYTPDYAKAEQRMSLVGEDGVVLVYAPKSPMMELIANLAGIENLSYIMADAEDELAETLQVMERSLRPALDITLAAPCDCIMIPENITSEAVGKSIYNDYIHPVHVDWVSRIKVAGKFSLVHLDGTMRGLITEIASSGFDVIEALTPAPVGDIEYARIKDHIRGKNIIWGGVPGAYFTDQVTDAEFDAFVREVLEIAKSEPRYVLGVADQVPPYSRPERIRRVAELVEKYG